MTSPTVLEYPLSPKYIPSWSIGEALRELIANALDADPAPKIYHRGNQAFIEDAAAGIPKSFWVIGEGNHGAIGQFGEGLKMACLVLARERRGVAVHTVGYTIRPTLGYSNMYETEVLMLSSEPNSRISGTSVEVQCSEPELAATRDRFLKLSPEKVLSVKLGVLGAPGKLYINGVYVQSIKSLWGYNVANKTLANRDRSVLDMHGVKTHVAEVLRELTGPKMIADLLKASQETGKEVIELDCWPSRLNPEWVRAFHGLFGRDAILADSLAADRHLSGLGWTVVSLPMGLRCALALAGVPTSTEVISKMKETKMVLDHEPLTEAEAEVLRIAKAIARDLVPDSAAKGVKVVLEFPTDSGKCHTLGMYRGQTVYIHRECLGDVPKAAGVMVHEYLHGAGYLDETREFESAITELIGRVAAERFAGHFD